MFWLNTVIFVIFSVFAYEEVSLLISGEFYRVYSLGFENRKNFPAKIVI